MPIFFLIFIVFIIWLGYELRKSDSRDKSQQKDFWDKEMQANSTRNSDISNLPYVTVDLSSLPFTPEDSDIEDKTLLNLEADVKVFENTTMVDLSNYSNTELKLSYGVGNFKKLSEYDLNYTSFIIALNEWGEYLFEADNFDHAKLVFEYAASLHADTSNVYLRLGELYANEGNTLGIEHLIDIVSDLNSVRKDSVLTTLRKYLS
ncbi:MAG: hypothetical protein K6G65_07595 [Lachnospiraceae bacterium]|nr:hypothetical protein [Lachnospiraceae bacterium]